MRRFTRGRPIAAQNEDMHVQTTTKLYPPKALLWNGPMPYQRSGARGGTTRANPCLSRDELRSIVSEMLG
jgi:hypothetical protein